MFKDNSRLELIYSFVLKFAKQWITSCRSIEEFEKLPELIILLSFELNKIDLRLKCPLFCLEERICLRNIFRKVLYVIYVLNESEYKLNYSIR